MSDLGKNFTKIHMLILLTDSPVSDILITVQEEVLRMLEKLMGYAGCALAGVGLLWGMVILEMGLTMSVIGGIMMLVGFYFYDEERR